jgi:malate dehydrogenase (oxaloacetate-decarboxylating)(NADP+)
MGATVMNAKRLIGRTWRTANRLIPRIRGSAFVTAEMFMEAAHAVADQVSPEQLNRGMLFPPQSNILETEIKRAIHVARMVFENNLVCVERPADYEAFIRSHVYKPEYRNLL